MGELEGFSALKEKISQQEAPKEKEEKEGCRGEEGGYQDGQEKGGYPQGGSEAVKPPEAKAKKGK